MKNINKFIIEKLKLSKNNDINKEIISSLCEYFNSDYNETKFISKYLIDSERFFNKHVEYIASPFELLFFLALMLIDDNEPIEQVRMIGYTSYKGKWNPYDYSWYEEETKDGMDILDICRIWINDNFNEFKKIYDFCKKHYKYYKSNHGIDEFFYIYDDLDLGNYIK